METTPVVLPRKSHGQRSLVGYSPWDHKESDTTEHSTHTHRRPEQERNLETAWSKPVMLQARILGCRKRKYISQVMEEIPEYVCGKDWCHLGGLGLRSHRALINQPWRSYVPALTLHLSFISIIKTSHKLLVTVPNMSSYHGLITCTCILVQEKPRKTLRSQVLDRTRLHAHREETKQD